MNIFAELKNNKKLSHNEQVIADYILKYPDQVIQMNTKELSKACFVSVATIYRLCDKLSLSGFSELKVKISSSIHENYLEAEGFDYDFPVKKNQTHYQIIQKLKEDYENTLNSTANLFNLDVVRQAANALKKAKKIDIYTSAGNIYFAQNFMFQMQEIGKEVNVPIEEYHQRLCAANSDATHLAIMITFGGRGLLTEAISQMLYDNQTPILLISSVDFKFEKIKVDYQIHISPYENHYRKISSFSTRFSILYILDVLFMSYFQLDYDKNLEKKLSLYHQISQKKIE